MEDLVLLSLFLSRGIVDSCLQARYSPGRDGKKQLCQDCPVEVVHLMYYMYMYLYLVGGQGDKEDWKVNRRNQRHQSPKHQNSKYLTYVAWH